MRFIEECPELAEAQGVAQLAQCLGLNLPDTLAGYGKDHGCVQHFDDGLGEMSNRTYKSSY